MGLTTGGRLPYNCVRKVAFLWWVLPWLGQSSLHSFVSFCEPLSLPKVVTLNSSSGYLAPSGVHCNFGASWRASFERGFGPNCGVKGLDPLWTDDDGDPALMVLRVCSASPNNYTSFPFLVGCGQLRTRDFVRDQDKRPFFPLARTLLRCCWHSEEFFEHCSCFSSCLSRLPRSVARRRSAMALLILYGMFPYTLIGQGPTTLPPLVWEGAYGGVGRGLQGSVPLSARQGQDPHFSLMPSHHEMVLRQPNGWDQVLAILVFLAFAGHVPTFLYREKVSMPFHYLNAHTKVYKATMSGFRGHAIRVRRNKGMGQCFWRSTGDQCSWYRRKNLALQNLLPSTIHSEQGSPYAWATHTEIAAFAQGASTRVVVISTSQGCVYCFEPPEVATTLHILHHHDHFERISNFQGKAFHAQSFQACHFQGGPALFPIETVCHPDRQAALQTSVLKGGAIRAKAPPLAACRDLTHWIQATYALHGIPMTPQGDRPINNTPLSYLPPQARYDDGLSHPSTLKAGGKTGGKKAGLRRQWADESDGKATDTEAEEEKRGIDAQMGSDPIARQRVKEEPPDDDMDEESWAGQSACDDDFLLGDFEAKPTRYTEEPRNLSPEEITREVGEPVALNASLLIEENSLPDPPVGIAGYGSFKGERTLVYPPLLGLARLSFFRDQENDPPFYPPGFYCLFCRWRLNGGQWAKKYDNFTSLLQHMSSGWVRCCDPKIYHFYKKQYQWHRRAFSRPCVSKGSS